LTQHFADQFLQTAFPKAHSHALAIGAASCILLNSVASCLSFDRRKDKIELNTSAEFSPIISCKTAVLQSLSSVCPVFGSRLS
jgi:hypothetical protein